MNGIARHFVTVPMRALAREIESGRDIRVTLIDADCRIVGETMTRAASWIVAPSSRGPCLVLAEPLTFDVRRAGRGPVGYILHTALGEVRAPRTTEVSENHFEPGRVVILCPVEIYEEPIFGPRLARTAA